MSGHASGSWMAALWWTYWIVSGGIARVAAGRRLGCSTSCASPAVCRRRRVKNMRLPSQRQLVTGRRPCARGGWRSTRPLPCRRREATAGTPVNASYRDHRVPGQVGSGHGHTRPRVERFSGAQRVVRPPPVDARLPHRAAAAGVAEEAARCEQARGSALTPCGPVQGHGRCHGRDGGANLAYLGATAHLVAGELGRSRGTAGVSLNSPVPQWYYRHSKAYPQSRRFCFPCLPHS